MSRVVVITGASGGIGAALASQLAGQGDRVVLAARRRSELEAVAKACGGLAVVADVSRRADVERLRDEALAKFGRVDAWVNNAGRGISRKVLELTDADVDEMIAVNLKSAIYGMQAIVPHFVERGDGHVVNVSSNLSKAPLATFRSIYSASKAALNALSANLRVDLARAHPGVKVSVVLPGPVATDFAKNALAGTPGGLPPSVAVQSAEEVAQVVVDVLRHPRPEAYTSPEVEQTARRYAENPAAFEAMLAKR